MTNPYFSNTIDLVAFTKARAGDVEANFSAVEVGFDAVQTAIAAAQSYASAPPFDAATAYTNGFVVFSTVDRQLYRRNSAGTSATDPSADATNWTRVVIGLTRVDVSGTSVTAVPGNNYYLNNAALTAVTAPTLVDGARFAVTPANGLKTNTIAFGAAIVRGYSGTATGTFEIDLGAPMEFVYSSVISRWVLQ
jgi:hypothetical protein